MIEKKITAIYGFEPRREGEYPDVRMVGHHSYVAIAEGAARQFLVTDITRREHNLGTYGIEWFDVHSADRVELSVNALSVAEVHFAPEVEA